MHFKGNPRRVFFIDFQYRYNDYSHTFIVPTGLLALQGEDELGRYIRKHLKELGVMTDFIEGTVLDYYLFVFPVPLFTQCVNISGLLSV